jgi:FkbM family methyltransferase
MMTEPSAKHRLLRLFGHQRWIARGRDRVIRRFCHPTTSPDARFEVDYFGYKYPGTLADYLDWMIYFFGRYEPAELTLLRNLVSALRPLRSDLAFFDVGANVGTHSLFLSRHADAVHAFEPNPAVACKIVEKITRNGIVNITVHPIGLSDANATLPFYPPSGENAGVGTFVHDGQLLEPIMLDTRRGDDYFKSRALPRIDILKMDIEGFEPRALFGLRERLNSDRPIIVMEMCGLGRRSTSNVAEFVNLLYPNHLIFNLIGRYDWMDYRLLPFDYETQGDVLIIPGELSGHLQDAVAAHRRG